MRQAKGHRTKVRKRFQSEGQRRYMAQLRQENAEIAKENCHCAGCIMCKGNTPGCLCDRDLSGLYLRKAIDARTTTPRDSGGETSTTAQEQRSPRIQPGGPEEGIPF